jgi:hypothetical protein
MSETKIHLIGLKHWAISHYNQLGYIYIVFFSLAIFFRPFTAPGQLLIIDSRLYMEIASYVVDGSFWSRFLSGDAALYWYWPMGYPFMMGLIAKAFGAELFLTGRILNFMAYLLIVYSVKNIFPEKWSFYVFLIGTASFLGLFTQTLTEAVFVAFGFLGLSQMLKEKGQAWIVVMSFTFMALTRYIGVFTIIFLGVYFIFVRKRKWFLITCSVLILVAAYILTEWVLFKALPTSIISPPQVDRLTLFGQFLISLIGYFSYFEIDHWGGSIGKVLFFVGLFPFIYVIRKWIKKREKSNLAELNEKTLIFFLFGSCYLLMFLFVLFGLGWDHDGWGIQSRYVAPGILFLILGWFEWVKFNVEDSQNIKLLILVSSMTVLLYAGFFQSFIDQLKAYGAEL